MTSRLGPSAASAREWWTAADGRERVVGGLTVVVVAALAGAFLFGAWHVVVGGLIRGNVRAAEFGIALAGATGFILVVGGVLVGRRLRA